MKKTVDMLKPFLSSLVALKALFSVDFWFKDADGNYLIGEQRDNRLSESSKIITLDATSFSEQLENIVLTEKDIIKFGPISMRYERTKDGTDCIYETDVFTKEGDFLGVLGYSKDITQEVLLSEFPGFAYRSINDAEYTMIFLSDGCRELTGYTAKDFYAKTPSFYDLIRPDYRKRLLKQWENDLAHGKIGSEEYPITTASGEIKWVWEQYKERQSSNSVYMATEGFITDVTTKKLAEEALMESEERFRAIFEKAPLGIGIFDTKTGKSLQVNDKFCELLGMDQKEVSAMSWLQYSHPDDIEPNLKHLETMEATGIGFTMDRRYYKKDGSLMWVNMTITPLSTKKGEDPLHLAMFVDITDRKMAEEEILYLSYHDALTGLYNRRYYEMALEKIDVPHNLPLTVILADVDDLKKVNDSFGHDVGDELLRISAEAIKDNLRKHDMVARTGGDEFTIILPNTGKAEAEEVKKKILSSLNKKCLKNINCSISMGAATKEGAEEPISKIIKIAEDHMYKCKQLYDKERH